MAKIKYLKDKENNVILPRTTVEAVDGAVTYGDGEADTTIGIMASDVNYSGTDLNTALGGIKFGVDADGKWGYIPRGADSVVPFKSLSPLDIYNYGTWNENFTKTIGSGVTQNADHLYLHASSDNFARIQIQTIDFTKYIFCIEYQETHNYGEYASHALNLNLNGKYRMWCQTLSTGTSNYQKAIVMATCPWAGVGNIKIGNFNDYAWGRIYRMFLIPIDNITEFFN